MKTFGTLKAHVIGAEHAEAPVVVLLHGFGAPGSDLVPLARALRTTKPARFVMLEAPLELATPFGVGRAWWMIDPMRFQQAILSGSMDALEREEPAGLTEARTVVASALREVRTELSPPKLILGGFSQGSMVALDLTLRDPKLEVAGLVLMSSTLLARDTWTKAAPQRRGLSVLLCHGTRDPVLPFPQAQRLRALLEDAGLDVNWIPFDGQHEIPPPVLTGTIAFLERLL